MKINKNYQSSSEEETKKIAKDFAKLLKSGDVVALFGDLGSGKTVFVKGLARSLGIKTTITSPTFVLIKSYPIYRAQKSLSFYHLDLYRVSGTKDIKSLGLKELFSKDSIVVIEWADRLKHLPKKRIDVFLEAINVHTRRITIDRRG